MFSLPSSETQSPRSRSCTLRVGLDVIGTSYSQALTARMHRQTATPKPNRRQIKFDEFRESSFSLEIDLRRNTTALTQKKLSSFRNYLGSFDAITSIFSIEGDFARSSAAFSLRACATLPFKCASRPESSANVSKIP